MPPKDNTTSFNQQLQSQGQNHGLKYQQHLPFRLLTNQQKWNLFKSQTNHMRPH